MQRQLISAYLVTGLTIWTTVGRIIHELFLRFNGDDANTFIFAKTVKERPSASITGLTTYASHYLFRKTYFGLTSESRQGLTNAGIHFADHTPDQNRWLAIVR